MSGVQHITVGPEDDGQRLDRWFKKHVPGVPFGLLQKLIRKGQIRVDGKRAKTDTRLTTGQDVRIPPVQDPETKSKIRRLSPEEKAYIRSLVIYDDGDVVALNKPEGIATQGGTGQGGHHIDGLLDGLKNKDGIAPRLVHRLDKETSGVLLLARSAAAVRKLGDSFKSKDVKKIYVAIVVPAPEEYEGTVKAPLLKVKDKTVVDTDEGKYAATDFVVLDKAGKAAAFMAFWPRTGRTHQIRVHAASVMECPILGDDRYGGKVPEELEELDLAKRMHLHALRIIVPHPVQNKKILDLKAPLPDDLRKSWKALGFSPNLKIDPFE
ncbi:MAG: RluA family pseudouridine synthase [Rhodospirillales bacterium]|nr:RluA family pseudouridine synthase [Rhodospirillales bacterium]